MREIENPCETLKCLRAVRVFFIFYFMGRAELNFGILFLD